ncbi:hypothetical protein [Saccharothrix sp. 6-C]|uniref:hypothetical protein n=1 Tax=Saccharothrix sp. 6-C TaxID=2781735 RepID=UPI001F2F15C8|nr:hypothetical protein [Saccharothrix sp. 6-C]
MNPHDVSDVLHHRAGPPEIPHAARMDGVRARVRRVRRRRAFVAVACAVLALVGGTLVTRPALLDSRPAAPEPFPEYLLSSRVLAQTWGHTPEPLTIRFTPTSAPEDLTLIFRCDFGDRHTTGDKQSLSVAISVDGQEVARTACRDDATSTGDRALAGSLRTGRESLVRLTVLGHMSEPPVGTTTPAVGPAPDGIAIRLAVGEHVPVTEYPLPPPPEEPVRVDEYVGGDADIVLRADPLDPNKPQKVVVAWRGLSSMVLMNGSPGRLRVLVGDVTVADASNYGYTPSGVTGSVGFDPTGLVPGQPVEISVVPEGAQGDWVLALWEED